MNHLERSASSRHAAWALPALILAAVAAPGCGNKDKPAGGSGAAPKPTAAAETPAPTGSASIKGVVTFDGPAPSPEPWAGTGNPECKGLRPDSIQLVKVQDKKLEDVFVYVKDGLPKGSYPVPTAPVPFDQKGCEFSPRVFGVMAGQPIAGTNSDKLLHNVKSPEFNQAFPFGLKRELSLKDAAVMSTIKCDVHPWMRAYAGVMEHPYFAVTKADGAYEIKGLVDGEYTVAVWHEKLGTQDKKVKASAAAPGAADFEFKAK
jgi:hypothetical protein